MTEKESISKRLEEISELNEARFMEYFHQMVENQRKTSWHDRHIKRKSFMVGGHVFLYDRKFLKSLGKPQMHWLGPFIVAEVKETELLI